MAPATLEMGMVCSQILPGPVRTVLKKPSPPSSLFFRPLTCWMSMDTVDSKPSTQPVSTIICCPGARSYSTSSPSTSAKAMPEPDRRCMMKPSPPKKPVPSFLLKWTDICTPASEARKALFCSTISLPGAI